MANLTEMQAFTTVVEQGGITVAARQLGVSKSAVSKHISNLEDRLGARLLSRSTRRVSPTEIGLAYYDRASRVLNDAGEADALVASLQSKPSGLLRITAATDFGVVHLSPIIGQFLEEFPDLSVSLVLQNRRAELISEGFDVGIRLGEMDDSSLRARKFAQTCQRLIASPGYLEKHGQPQTVADLSHHRLLHACSRPSGQVWSLRDEANRVQHVRASGGLAINDGQSLLTAAQSGLGIAYLPDYLCGYALRHGSVSEVLPGLPKQVTNLQAVYPGGRFTQPKVRAFIDFVVGAFADHSNGDW